MGSGLGGCCWRANFAFFCCLFIFEARIVNQGCERAVGVAAEVEALVNKKGGAGTLADDFEHTLQNTCHGVKGMPITLSPGTWLPLPFTLESAALVDAHCSRIGDSSRVGADRGRSNPVSSRQLITNPGDTVTQFYFLPSLQPPGLLACFSVPRRTATSNRQTDLIPVETPRATCSPPG